MRYTHLTTFFAALGLAQENTHKEIIKGHDASPLSFPFIASLEHVQHGQYCGGSIIGQSTILTAAHCCMGFSPGAIQVRYGTKNINSGGAVTAVRKIIIYPGYNPKTYDGDYCILQVNPMNFAIGPSRPLALSPVESSRFNGLPLSAAGWGRTNPQTKAVPGRLQTATLQGIPRSSCAQAWGAANIGITINEMCATPFSMGDQGVSECNGDSGGPLTDEAGTVLVGVVSFGNQNCTAIPYPNVFADVYTNRGFISQFIS